MASYQYKLTTPPEDERAHELWIQHAAGFILFQDSRAYAIAQIDPSLEPEMRDAVVKGIDDALYGLMMIVDGVSGCLGNDKDEISLSLHVRHLRKTPSGERAPVRELDLQDGDGMCMGIHGWRAGDFGKNPPAEPKPKQSRRG